MTRPNVAIAFAVACLAVAIFSTMDAVVKGLALAIGTYNTLLWRSFAGVAVSGVPWLLRRPPRPSRAAIKLHAERGAVSAAMGMLFFWGLARMPMAQAFALTFIAPLVAQGLAVLMLGERMKPGAVVGSVLGFAGVIVILIGQIQARMGSEALYGTAAVLVSALCYAYNIILMRRQSQVADPYEVAFFQNVAMAICLGLFMGRFGEWPAGHHWPVIIFAAMLATISLFLLSWAYAHAEAGYLVPSEYTAFLWAILLGYLFFGEHVGLATIAGGILIMGGCVIAARSAPKPLPEREVVP